MAADLQYWEKTARQIREAADSPKIVIEKCTIPVKTALAMERILTSKNGSVEFRRHLQPGVPRGRHGNEGPRIPRQGAHRLRETDRGIRARREIVDIYANWVPRERIIESNIWSSELSKLVANAFLAQRISSINAISALCEKTDADVQEVAKAMGFDSRIGTKFLNASVGFGGSCFKKDILNLVYLCRSYGLQTRVCS